MESTDTFFSLTDMIRQADAYVFLAGWLYMMYTKRLRWGWDYDNMEKGHKAEIEKLSQLVTRYQDQVQERLDRLEKAKEVPNEN